METRQIRRTARHARIRSHLTGTPERPRLSIFRSLRHISAQLIDDTQGKTIAAASDMSVKKEGKNMIQIAQEVGELLAQKAVEKKITQAVFDRGGYKYHGQISALAEGARSKGLKF